MSSKYEHKVKHLPSLNRSLLNLNCATTPPHINNWNSKEGNYSRVIATAVVDMGRGIKWEGVHSWWISHSSSWLRLFLPTTFKPTAATYKICCISEWIPLALLGSPSTPATFINQELVKKKEKEKHGCLPQLCDFFDTATVLHCIETALFLVTSYNLPQFIIKDDGTLFPIIC